MLSMTKRLGALFLLLGTSFATVTVSGNLVNPATGSVSSRAFVRFYIRGCGGNQPRVSGTGVVLPSYTDFTPTAGAISGTLYDSLTEISCGGSVGATWYGVVAYYDGKPGPEVPYNVTGASFNLNSATPNTTSPVVAAPTGDSTYCRIDAGNCGFSGTVSPSTDNTRDLGSVGAAWRTGYFKTSLVFLGTTINSKTGSGAMVLGTAPTISNPTLTTPTLGAGTFTSLASASANPASSGAVRLANSDCIDWRESTNSTNNALCMSTDTLSYGGTGGISTSGGDITSSGQVIGVRFVSSSANVAQSGTIRLANNNQIKFRNNANGADLTGFSVNTSDQAVIGSASVGASIPGKVVSYNGIATVSDGVPYEVAAVDLTSQTAAITTTTLYTTTASQQFRLSWNAKVTTAAGVSSTLGALTIVYTDPDGVAQTITAPATAASGTIGTTNAGNSITSVLIGMPLLLNAKTGTNITYAFAYASNAANAMNYNLHIKLEAL